MENKEKKKDKLTVRFSTAICIIVIFILIYAIVLMAYYNIQSQKSNDQIIENLDTKSKALEEQVERLQNIVENQNVDKQGETETTQPATETKETQSKELSETRKKELYDNVFENKALIQDMVNNKDFSVAEFTDHEILACLPNLDNSDIFTQSLEQGDGYYAVASTEGVQNLAETYFGRAIQSQSLEKYLKDGKVQISIPTGYGIVNYKLVSLDTIGDNMYELVFKYIESDSEKQYTLTFSENNGQIVYLKLEK